MSRTYTYTIIHSFAVNWKEENSEEITSKADKEEFCFLSMVYKYVISMKSYKIPLEMIIEIITSMLKFLYERERERV